jgi:hypothetical protein
MAYKKQFSNTKSIVKVETGIVTVISYHHYLKIVGKGIISYDHICKKKVEIFTNENFNLLHYVEWDRFVTLAGSKSGLRVTLSYLQATKPRMFFLTRCKMVRSEVFSWVN